jgi:hypothetical protein
VAAGRDIRVRIERSAGKQWRVERLILIRRITLA